METRKKQIALASTHAKKINEKYKAIYDSYMSLKYDNGDAVKRAIRASKFFYKTDALIRLLGEQLLIMTGNPAKKVQLDNLIKDMVYKPDIYNARSDKEKFRLIDECVPAEFKNDIIDVIKFIVASMRIYMNYARAVKAHLEKIAQLIKETDFKVLNHRLGQQWVSGTPFTVGNIAELINRMDSSRPEAILLVYRNVFTEELRNVSAKSNRRHPDTSEFYKDVEERLSGITFDDPDFPCKVKVVYESDAAVSQAVVPAANQPAALTVPPSYYLQSTLQSATAAAAAVCEAVSLESVPSAAESALAVPAANVYCTQYYTQQLLFPQVPSHPVVDESQQLSFPVVPTYAPDSSDETDARATFAAFAAHYQ